MRLAYLVFSLLHLLTFASGAPLPNAHTVAHELDSRAALQNYILIFQSGPSTPDNVVKGLENEMKNLGVKVNYEYQTIIKGFSITLNPDLLPRLQAMNDKNYPFILEQDKKVHTE